MNLSQATVLITGSTDGVGRRVAERAAQAGARVLVHGRNDVKGRNTRDEIHHKTPQSRVEYCRADLASLDDVRRLAGQVVSTHDGLEILISTGDKENRWQGQA